MANLQGPALEWTIANVAGWIQDPAGSLAQSLGPAAAADLGAMAAAGEVDGEVLLDYYDRAVVQVDLSLGADVAGKLMAAIEALRHSASPIAGNDNVPDPPVQQPPTMIMMSDRALKWSTAEVAAWIQDPFASLAQSLGRAAAANLGAKAVAGEVDGEVLLDYYNRAVLQADLSLGADVAGKLMAAIEALREEDLGGDTVQACLVVVPHASPSGSSPEQDTASVANPLSTRRGDFGSIHDDLIQSEGPPLSTGLPQSEGPMTHGQWLHQSAGVVHKKTRVNGQLVATVAMGCGLIILVIIFFGFGLIILLIIAATSDPTSCDSPRDCGNHGRCSGGVCE